MNKGNLIQNGVRKSWRESPHTGASPCSWCRRKEDYPLASNSKLPSPAASEKLPPLQILIFLQWTFVQNSPRPACPSNFFLPYLYKKTALPCSEDLSMVHQSLPVLNFKSSAVSEEARYCWLKHLPFSSKKVDTYSLWLTLPSLVSHAPGFLPRNSDCFLP